MKKRLLTAILAMLMVFLFPLTASAAWQQDETGNWQWKENGNIQTGWKQIDNQWYFFDQFGIMKVGWVLDAGKWYYLNENGTMKTGWLNKQGVWYFLDPSGILITNSVVKIDDSVYYFDANGVMIIGEALINGKYYTFNKNGVAIGEIPSPSQIFTQNSTDGENSNNESIDYMYFVISDFNRIQNQYPTATPQLALVTIYTNEDDETCVLIDSWYKIIKNYNEVTIHNLTTNERIIDPVNYYKKMINSSYGAEKIKYMRIQSDVLKILVDEISDAIYVYPEDMHI